MNLKKLATFCVGGATVLAAASLALPRHVNIERTALMETAPEAVIELASSNAGYQRFNPYKDDDPDLQIALFGPDSGVGSGFSFEGKDGTGQQTVASVSADRVVFNIDLGPFGHAHPSGIGMARWWLIDLKAFRAALIRGTQTGQTVRCGDKVNGDGTAFKGFNMRSFPADPPLVVAGSG